MADQTWMTRELPILRAIVSAEESNEDPHAAAYSVAELPSNVVMKCIQRLFDDGYIEAKILRQGDGNIAMAHVIKALPKALREVGVWPQLATPLEQKRARRMMLMQRVYDLSDGDSDYCVDPIEIGGQYGWTQEETRRIFRYLINEGLLSLANVSDNIKITHAGVVEIEQALYAPDTATDHFPPINVINVYGNVQDSQLQAGTTNSQQDRS